MTLEGELKDKFGDNVKVKLFPSGGGVFEVKVDGVLIYSKKATGRHANPGEVVKLIESK